MRYLLFAILLLIQVSAYATFNKTMYVTAKNGLNVRETQDANSPVIAKLYYGEAVVIILTKTEPISINGFDTQWQKINHGKGAGGYIVGAYLLPFPPPANDTMSLKGYADQLSEYATMPVTNTVGLAIDNGTEDVKTLYKNGIIHIQHNVEEYLSSSLIIPDISMRETYIILKNLEHLNDFLPQDGSYPKESNRTDLGNSNYRGVTIIKDILYSDIERITFYADTQDLIGSVTIKMLNGQVIIIYEYGV